MNKQEFKKLTIMNIIDLLIRSIKNTNRKTIKLSELQRVKVHLGEDK